MATPEPVFVTRFRSFVGAVGRLVLVWAFTGVETVTLVVWLALVTDAQTASLATAAGIVVLLGGLSVEHVLTETAVDGLSVSPSLGPIAAVSLSETLLWALWLLVADRIGGLVGVLVAGVVLAAALVPQHTVEDNGLRGKPLGARLVARGTVGFSVLEAAGATAWLALVRHGGQFAVLSPLTARGIDPATLGVAALSVALFVEHVLGVRFARRG